MCLVQVGLDDFTVASGSGEVIKPLADRGYMHHFTLYTNPPARFQVTLTDTGASQGFVQLVAGQFLFVAEDAQV